MHKKPFKKFLLIATFAIFTITSTSLNYCFGNNTSTYMQGEDPLCPDCGSNNIYVIYDEVYDGVAMIIKSTICPECNYRSVEYFVKEGI